MSYKSRGESIDEILIGIRNPERIQKAQKTADIKLDESVLADRREIAQQSAPNQSDI